jgi:hypothetical protein
MNVWLFIAGEIIEPDRGFSWIFSCLVRLTGDNDGIFGAGQQLESNTNLFDYSPFNRILVPRGDSNLHHH